MGLMSIIFILLMGLFIGIVIGALGTIIIRARKGGRPPPRVQLIAEQNHICRTDACGALIRYAIQNPTTAQNAGRDIELTVKFDGDESDRPVDDVILGPEFEQVFSATDPRIFYAGSGNYNIGVKLFPASSPGPDQTVQINVMKSNDGFEIVQLGATHFQDTSVTAETFLTDTYNDKISIRTCRGMRIHALAVYGFTLGPDSQFQQDAWALIRENEGLADVTYPHEVEIQIESPGGTLNLGMLGKGDWKYFGDAPEGETAVCSTMIEIVEGLVIKGTRYSGSEPFPRNSIVSWKIFVQIDCE